MPPLIPDISWSDTFTLGRSSPSIAGTANLFERMKDELKPHNLRAENGDDPFVALKVKNPEAAKFALFAPLPSSSLVWIQRLAPLNIILQRLQNTPLETTTGVSVIIEPDGEAHDPNAPRERFNMGMYRNLSDAERMNLNAQVEDHVAGVRHRFDMQSGASATHEIGFEEHYRPERPGPGIITGTRWKQLSIALLDKVSERATQAHETNLTARVTTAREDWRVGQQSFDTQTAAHIAAQKKRTVAHLAMDVVDVGDV
jgi:hypothetical protein